MFNIFNLLSSCQHIVEPEPFQEAMLVQLKGLHFLNAPSFMDRVMMILRPFMKKELLDTLQIHQTGSMTLDKYVPQEALPKEAGGEYLDFVSARGKSCVHFPIACSTLQLLFKIIAPSGGNE